MKRGFSEVGCARVANRRASRWSPLSVENGVFIYAAAGVGDAKLITCLVIVKSKTKLQLQ